MTTGCGRRCQFCLPDLNPQIDVPKDRIMAGVRANVREGNKQISLATEDMFIWGQVHTETPFFFPNREALLDLYASVVNTPGVEQHVLSHATIAPSVVDPVLIRKLSELLLDKSPIRLPVLSTHPEKRALVPLIGLETGSVRLAKQIMPSKGVPFPIDEWPSVVVNGLKVLNENNWFPAMTLIIGSPGETDDDTRATLDLIYEVERRGLFAFFIPSIFTPLHDTRLEHAKGRHRNAQADAAPVAVDDEVLEDEPASRPDELVGSRGVALRRHRPVAVEVTQVERPELHLAAADVRQRPAGIGDEAPGQDPRRLSADAQGSQGAARDAAPRTSPVPACRYRRSASDAGRSRNRLNGRRDSADQAVDADDVGIDVGEGGVEALAVGRPRHRACHEHRALAKVGDRPHVAAIGWNQPQVGGRAVEERRRQPFAVWRQRRVDPQPRRERHARRRNPSQRLGRAVSIAARQTSLSLREARCGSTVRVK